MVWQHTEAIKRCIENPVIQISSLQEVALLIFVIQLTKQDTQLTKQDTENKTHIPKVCATLLK